MNTRPHHSAAILLAILLSASLAIWARPTTQLARTKPPIDIAALIPQHVGKWALDTNSVTAMANPKTGAALDRIYSQTLSRTYVDHDGNRIMLALAYGSKQNDQLKAHRPEICYPAQGFALLSKTKGAIVASGNRIPIIRLVTSNGIRVEPVTYWLAVGNQAAATDLQRKLIQLRYGLTGTIPDGMLVRVSSIDLVPSHAFALHDAFVRSLVASVDANQLASLGLLAIPETRLTTPVHP